jgi:tRNA(Ile)-lysidine synthase
MDLPQRFKDFIKQNNLFNSEDRLLLAVSGGVDSVVLCELCKLAGYEFAIAHCNFRLRDKESERDKEFVRELAKKYGVEFFLKEFDTEKYAEENKLSIQEAARELRYSWFHELIGHRQYAMGKEKLPAVDNDCQMPIAKCLLTAHHADDNIETLLMNFCRGTGLNGLTGIPVRTDAKVSRPLLSFWKDELIEFAKQNQLEFVNDSSNQSSKYARNLFRNEIIPLIGKAYPQVKENLLDNIQRFKEINQLYQFSISELKKKLFKKKNNEIHVSIRQLMGYKNRAIIFEIISDFGFTDKHIDEVIKLAESENGKYIQSPVTSNRIIKFNHWFIVSTEQSSDAETIVIEEGSRNIQYLPTGQAGSIFNLQFSTVESKSFKIETSNSIACLDADLINFPLILRKWKQGDYFYPLGMKKKKKVARFLIDQKLSKTEKEKAWVLEMNKKIIWVIGMRIDDRFKITGKTKRILTINLLRGQA